MKEESYFMRKYVKQSLILFAIMSFMLFGCGGTQVEDAQNSESQESEVAVKESPAEEETEETEKSDGITESFETEEQNQAATQMVDWETFATQADNDKICLVVSNEEMGTQTVLFNEEAENSTCFYNYMQGDKIAVPIKDNIIRICYYIAEVDGTQKTDIQNVYWKDDGEKLPYIEIKIENEPQYYISVFDNENNKYTFGLYK